MKLEEIILNVQEEIEQENKLSIGISLMQSHRRRIATAIKEHLMGIVPGEREEVVPNRKFGVRIFDKIVGWNICRQEIIERIGEL